MKRPPIGVEDYLDACSNYYYVDKTEFIRRIGSNKSGYWKVVDGGEQGGFVRGRVTGRLSHRQRPVRRGDLDCWMQLAGGKKRLQQAPYRASWRLRHVLGMY